METRYTVSMPHCVNSFRLYGQGIELPPETIVLHFATVLG